MFVFKSPIAVADVTYPSSTAAVGLKTGNDDGTSVRSNLLSNVTVTPTGNKVVIEGILGRNANKDIAGTKVRQSRDEDGVWKCTIVKAAKFKDKFIPAGCTAANS